MGARTVPATDLQRVEQDEGHHAEQGVRAEHEADVDDAAERDHRPADDQRPEHAQVEDALGVVREQVHHLEWRQNGHTHRMMSSSNVEVTGPGVRLKFLSSRASLQED